MIMGDAVEVEVRTTVRHFSFTNPPYPAWGHGACLPRVSPGAGRKRRRSTSPWDRDRYEPRPRYDDYGMSAHDLHSVMRSIDIFRADPHRGGYSPRRTFHSSRPAPQDPHTLDYPASLKQYAEWFRYFFSHQAAEEDSLDKQAEMEAGDGSKPRNGIKSKWEKYKKDFSSNQVRVIFVYSFLSSRPFSCPLPLSAIQSFRCFIHNVIKTARSSLLKRWHSSFPILSCSQSRSSIACSNIIGSHPGSRRSTSPHRSS